VNLRLSSSAFAALLVSLVASPASADEGPASPMVSVMPTTPAAPPRPAATAVVPQPTPPPSAVPAPTPEELRHRRVVVHIDATRPSAVLERRVSVKEETGAFLVMPYKSTDATWEQVCVTPCSVDLDRFSSYRVRAQNDIAGSTTFTLPQHADVLHLNLHTGSLRVHRTAEAMSGIGIAAVIVGGALLVTATDFRHADDARAAGAITGGAGLVLAAIGIPLALATRTKVETEESSGQIANRYYYRGHNVPFLPEVDLGHGFTLTQRGIIF
jgi:hypothetical protein